MASFNKVVFLGNLTADPSTRYTQSGTLVANFDIAMNHRYTQEGEVREEVCYISIAVFGKQAESVDRYLNKGSSVIVDGRLKQSTWETDDGQKRSKHEVVAQSVTFMPKKSEGSPAAGPDEGDGGSDVPF